MTQSAQPVHSHSAFLRSKNPARPDEILGEVPISSADEVARAVAAAKDAYPAWKRTPIAERVATLRRLYDLVKRDSAEVALAMTREMGMPIQGAQNTIKWALNHFKWYLNNAERCLAPSVTFEDEKQRHEQVLEPFGVAGVIVPWNFPLSNFVMGAVQAILAGNTVVYKVSEEVPLFGQLLDRLVVEAKLPPGVFCQVYGDGAVGELLVRSPIDLLFFTGSSAAGAKLYAICAEKFIPCILELGGSDAGIVFADAQLDTEIENIFWAKFINNGQICCGLKRLFVEAPILDEVVERLTRSIAEKKLGDPEKEDTTFGPLVAERQRELLHAQVEEARQKGARVIQPLPVPPELQGAFYPPTLLLDVSPKMRAWNEELFGPVLPVIPFRTEDEAIRLANDTPYGLSGYVFTADRARFERVAANVETGAICLNGCDYSSPYNPFGGFKRSGLGKTGGDFGFSCTSRMKVISRWK